MPFLFFYLLTLLLLPPLTFSSSSSSPPPTELELLLQIKSSLDPHDQYLATWAPTGDPCGGSFEGVACDGQGHVVNISLQGKGLYGRIPAAIGGLRRLTGLYLHFNALQGEIPEEISRMSQLSELYLNVNNLSGEIPAQIGGLSNLQVLQLCYNKLSGSIPTQLGSLKKLTVLALQHNQLVGAIPASLGNVPFLSRLDLSFNHLFGSIPTKLANTPTLQILNVCNNSLSGNVPPALRRMTNGFQYANNRDLCGFGFPNLETCTAVDSSNPNRPEPFTPNGALQKDIPESANLPSNCSESRCSSSSRSPRYGIIFGVTGIFVVAAVIGLFTFSWYRRQKQKIGSSFDASDSRLSTDQVKEVCRKSASPLISLEYSNGWDPLSAGHNGNSFSQEILESFIFNLEEVERATQCFSEVNLLGKNTFSTTYRGILRDGSLVAIKCIAKTSCKSEEADFLMGLRILTSLKHENLVRLRGFCCSKGRGECFLIYDYAPNGNLLQCLDVKENNGKVLDWSIRTAVINGIARGLQYLHGNKGSKVALVYQNLSAEKVLFDGRFNPLLCDPGLHKLIVDDVVFSMLKASAAKGYLAPEYTTTGRFTQKNDVYAFGMIILQLLSGNSDVSQLCSSASESCSVADYMDGNLEGKFSESEAVKLWRLAFLCLNESPYHRPSIETVIQELGL